MPDIYKHNEQDKVIETQPCWKNWLIWERVFSSITKPGEPMVEIGRYRRCVRRLANKLPSWEFSDSDKARHKLPKCDSCDLYKRDTPDNRDSGFEEEFGKVDPKYKGYNPNKFTEPKLINDDSVPF